MTRVAIAQTDPKLGDTAHNLKVIESTVERAAAHGAELVIFPECALSGYVFHSVEEALGVAETVPGPTSQRIVDIAVRNRAYIVAGMLERVGRDCYNSALLVGPSGLEGVYRKAHTLCLGVDRFTTRGNTPYVVHHLPFGRIAIQICYDLRFPEPSRLLALAGAQAIVLPTNWPASSTIQPDVFTRARAAENRIFVLAADRVGEERGTRFLGRSQVVSPDGIVRSEASRSDPETIIEDIHLCEADEKHVVLRAGEHEMHCFEDRRPDLYDTMVSQGQPVTAS